VTSAVGIVAMLLNHTTTLSKFGTLLRQRKPELLSGTNSAERSVERRRPAFLLLLSWGKPQRRQTASSVIGSTLGAIVN